MSKNEKSLRDWVMMVAEHTPRIRAAGLGLLDALIAEHRAEVEALQVGRNADRERYAEALSEQMEEMETARDAALEEAEGKARQRSVSHRDWGREMQALDMESLADDIRALKSLPARQYVDAEKVRFELNEARLMEPHSTPQLYLDGWEAAVDYMARALGVDLDAKGEGKDVHTEHCCQRHGCKYGDAACTVTSGERMQSFPCADCEVSP